MDSSDRQIVQLISRVPKSLKEDLSEIAWKKRKSLNELMNLLLQSYVNRKKQQKK